MSETQCPATDEYGNRCIRPEHADDQRYPGHSIPLTEEQRVAEADKALDFLKGLI